MIRNCVYALPWLRRRNRSQHVLETLAKFPRYLSGVKNFYELLEITPKASRKDIKDAYFRLSKIYHPDKDPGNAVAFGKFLKLSEAYETLVSDTTRRDYDKVTFGASYFKETGAKGDAALRTGRTDAYNYDEWTDHHYEAGYDDKVRKWKNLQREDQEVQATEPEVEEQEPDYDAVRAYNIKVAVATILVAIGFWLLHYRIETHNTDAKYAQQLISGKRRLPPDDVKK